MSGQVYALPPRQAEDCLTVQCGVLGDATEWPGIGIVTWTWQKMMGRLGRGWHAQQMFSGAGAGARRAWMRGGTA